ncbi:MAG TPA: cupin-like domain-containing protein [Candidatus Acidoferrales bacterium]|jgi:hypothetical protein|nr:cupin-like domain-containing protein [Candidatus Acidoferrales bacterium]
MNPVTETFPTIPIERAGGLTPEVFQQRYLTGIGKPVIVTDALTSWKALSHWSFDLLKERYGTEGVAPRLPSDSNYLKLMTLGNYLHYLDDPTLPSPGLWVDAETFHPLPAPTETPAAPLYLGWNVFARHPELLEDVKLSPAFVEDLLPLLPAGLRKALDEETRFFAAGVMIGPKNAQLGIHHDLMDTHAYLAQIIGRKRCVLFSPEDSGALYNGKVNVDGPDFETFPLLRNATAYECILAPGELLFIPHHWWHHVVSLEKTITVNYNFFNRVNFSGYMTRFMRNLPTILEAVEGSPGSRAAMGIPWTCRGFDFPGSGSV